MNFLLDTCVLSELIKKRPNEIVVEWVRSQFGESLFISVLTVGEIRKGIVRLPTSKRKTDLQHWYKKLHERYEKRILPITVSTADVWGKLKGGLKNKGKTLSVIDSLIAATALEHKLVVVTRNTSGFAPAGVQLLNAWETD